MPSVSNTNDNINNDECDIEPEDSASQVSGSISRLSKISNQSMIRRIELEKKRAELKISHELQQAKAQVRAKAEALRLRAEMDEAEALQAKARAEAEALQAKARAKAEAVRLQAEMDEAEAEALARLRAEEAALDAEEKLLACSELSSTVTSLRSSKTCRSKLSSALSCKPKPRHSKSRVSLSKPLIEPSNVAEKQNCKPLANVMEPTVEKQCRYSLNPAAKEFVRDNVLPTNAVSNAFNQGCNATLFAEPHVATTPSACESAMKTYLDRQGRNEFISLASQIAYDGKNMSFVFYENQILRLMKESPFPDRRFEVLRASCVGQPREMVNLFFAPVKAMSTSQRVEKALARLKERYGVPGGLTSEPKVTEIRYGPKITFNTASLKAFNEELNLLEVYAYAHDEVNKLSGQLIFWILRIDYLTF